MFKSSLTKEFEKEIKKRHLIILSELKKNNKIRYYKFKNLRFKIYPDVFPPFPDSELLADIVSKIKNAGDVLDMGTGSGVLALSIAKNAKKIVAVDINRNALKSVRESAKLNNMNNIKVKYSNIFSNIKKKFDIILFNAPFRYFKPKNTLDASMTDYNYESLTKFFNQAKKHLKPKGKIYLIFSNTGDLSYLHNLIRKNNLKSKIVGKRQAKSYGVKNKLYYYVYKIIK